MAGRRIDRTGTVAWMLLFSACAIAFVLFMQPYTIINYKDYIAVLFPKGSIALQERNLLFIIQAVMLLVMIPVYVLTFVFSWKYRANNPKAIYDPDLVDNRVAEFIWWGIPLVLTLFIAVLSWYRTHELDPFKPIESNKKTLTIQAVALQWRWLFIYPEEKIATINFIQFPKETPLHFEITADAPMNSFWLPELGGQIYAMPKMKTELHLIANDSGDFRGSSANISGVGFSKMHFIARSSTEEEYQAWLQDAKKESKFLDFAEYTKLAEPSENDQVKTFHLNETNLFNRIIDKYMHP